MTGMAACGGTSFRCCDYVWCAKSTAGHHYYCQFDVCCNFSSGRERKRWALCVVVFERSKYPGEYFEILAHVSELVF